MRCTVVGCVLLTLSCSSPQTSSPTRSEPTSGSSRGAPSQPGHHHFWVVRQARDAVIHGDLAAAKGKLERIADGELGEEIPSDWTVWIEEMQEEAARAQRARSLKAVAGIVTSVASRCGDCHRSQARGPARLGLERLEQLSHIPGGIEPEHADHRWASEQLWLGMTIPLHQAWVRGSRALTRSPLHGEPEQRAGDAPDPKSSDNRQGAPSGNLLASPAQADPSLVAPDPGAPGRPPAVAKGLRALVGVGERIYEAGRPLPMARAYADYIARCDSCHSDE